MAILKIIFITSCTFYQILGSYTVLVEVTGDSQILNVAAATQSSGVAIDHIIISDDSAQLFSRKVKLLFQTRDNERCPQNETSLICIFYSPPTPNFQ